MHLLHRWLGIGIGLLVLVWFGSGVVMMYVPYPALTEQERMQWLAPIDGTQIKISALDAWQVATGSNKSDQLNTSGLADLPGVTGVPAAVRLNSIAGRPVYHFLVNGRWCSVWADTGAVVRVTPALAVTTALSAAPAANMQSIDLIDLDQWTFGRLGDHRPLYRVATDDAAGSILYISSRTGELVRDTTRSERAWNWAGSVMHWLYFTPLRAQGDWWRLVVMWTSGAAFVLVMLGMVLGLQRLRLRRRYAGGKRSPYRGWQGWHHWLGLSAGTLMITWLFSGWLSVTPFNWFSSPGVTEHDRLAFAGGPLQLDDLSAAAPQIVHQHQDLLELEWRKVDGTLYFSALDRRQRRLLDARSGAAIRAIPESVMLHALRATRPQAALLAVDVLTTDDDYYYSHHRQEAFPVLRARFQLADETTFYADAVQGQLAGHADRNSKWNRWLFNGLHQLDFATALRKRPIWDVMVISLCLLGAALTTTGLVLGWRRLKKRSTLGK